MSKGLSSAASRRAAIGIVALGVMALISVLGLLRVRSTLVELDLRAAQLSFTSSSRQILSERLPLAYFASLEPFARVVWPQSRTAPRRVLTDSHFSIEPKGEGRFYIRLHAISLPDDSIRVELENAGRGQYRLTLEDLEDPITLTLTVFGAVQCPVTGNDVCRYDEPGTITATSGDGPLRFEFQVHDEGVTLSSRVLVSDLDFSDLPHSRADTAFSWRRLSTIQSGRLYLESLKGEEIELRPFQRLDLDGDSGLIRSLVLGQRGVGVNFLGEVSGMETGMRGERNLMPTLLNWLRARQTLVLLWGAAIFLVALGEFAIKLWK